MNAKNNKTLHALLTQKGLMHRKADLVNSYTQGREESSSGMSDMEAGLLIAYLQRQPDMRRKKEPVRTAVEMEDDLKVQRMRNKIIAIAHNLGLIKKTQAVDKYTGRLVSKNDYTHLNSWMINHSYLNKKMDKYTIEELPKLVSQIEQFQKRERLV